jgi:hypothetical protein
VTQAIRAYILPNDPAVLDAVQKWLETHDMVMVFAYPRTPTAHNFAPRINQKVIDLFRAVFGDDFWSVVTRAGLAYMAASPAARQAAYIGPDVEDLPLTPDERDRLIAAL